MSDFRTSDASLLWFDEIGLEDRSRVGGKGASLGELRRAGIDVPSGFVVTAAAFRRFASHDVDAALPADFAEAVALAYRRLCGDGVANDVDEPVAVRSSATDEDGESASFAGLQDTYLWVRGETAVMDAIRRCWASLYNDAAVAYRARHAAGGDAVAMGVVVQRMVDAHAAGVMFTRSPLTGDPSVIAISSSFGLGSSVVGGEVTPDEFLLSKVTGAAVRTTISRKEIRHVPNEDGSGTREEAVPEDMQTQATLDADGLARLVELGRSIEKHYGCAQDIEWARDASGAIFVLQSRPETVWSGREREAVREASKEAPKEKTVRTRALVFRYASIVSLSNEDVLQILALLDASHFDELRVETDDFKLHLRRSVAANEPAIGPEVAAATADVPQAERAVDSSIVAPKATDGYHAVTAPMLGTFYGAPQPGAAPFVTIGTTVTPDTVIGIIEVMKLMNSVCAGANGEIVEIVARDGELVEFGDALVRIAPART